MSASPRNDQIDYAKVADALESFGRNVDEAGKNYVTIHLGV